MGNQLQSLITKVHSLRTRIKRLSEFNPADHPRNPAGTGRGGEFQSAGKSVKDPRALSAKQINQELDKLEQDDSKLNREFINAGRSTERPSDRVGKTDSLSIRFRDLQARQSALRNEITTRYGPGAPRRLPDWKRGQFGPRK